MSIAETLAKEGSISWIPIVVFFALAMGCLFWGKQWFLGGYVAYVLIGLGVFELWSKLHHGKTMSQDFIIWAGHSMRDYSLSWVALTFLVMAILALTHHLK